MQRKHYFLLIAILILSYCPSLLFSHDGSTDYPGRVWEEKYNKLKVKHEKAMTLLKQYLTATPTKIVLKGAKITFNIVDVKYSISLPMPSLEGNTSWLDNASISIGWDTPRFQDINEWSGSGLTKFNIQAGYSLFNVLTIYTSYDFVADWHFGFSINLLKAGTLLLGE